MPGKRCAVIYLERVGEPEFLVSRFLRSIERYPAGYDFDYIHVLKGFEAGVQSKSLTSFIRKETHDVSVRYADDSLYPTGALRGVIDSLDNEKILFLTSSSRILAKDWLRKFMGGFEGDPDIGIVGATGGFERQNYRDLSQPFPNVGIRTNAFMMDRVLYLKLSEGVFTREDELNFESGPNSLTKQLVGCGLKPAIVDRNGKIWSVEQWPNSRTFRSGHQEGLLVADKRTHDYDRSNDAGRVKLAQINWGGVASVSPNRWWRRARVEFCWRYLTGV